MRPCYGPLFPARAKEKGDQHAGAGLPLRGSLLSLHNPVARAARALAGRPWPCASKRQASRAKGYTGLATRQQGLTTGIFIMQVVDIRAFSVMFTVLFIQDSWSRIYRGILSHLREIL